MRIGMACLAVFLAPLTLLAQTQAQDLVIARFMDAVEANDTNTVSRMLATDPNLTHPPYYGRLPLHVAASKGHGEIVAALLKNGAEIDALSDTLDTSNAKLTALDAAIWYGHTNVCHQLLEAGANPNLLSPFEGSALHFAFRYSREETAGWLLDHGADPFLQGGNSYNKATPFELAITLGSGKLVPRMLREARILPADAKPGVQLPKDGLAPAFKEPAAQLLITRGSMLLAVAVQRGELEAVEALLGAGVSPKTTNERGRTLLQTQAASEAAASNAKGFSAERWLQIREILARNGAEDDVFAATARGDIAASRSMVSTNAGLVQLRDPVGESLLHWAVSADRPLMITFWLETGVPVAITNLVGQTALHLAAATGRAEHMKLLLAAHAPTIVRDNNGKTPLDAAVKAKQTEAIRLLLEEKATLQSPERGIAMTIHKAAEKGNLAALAALVEEKNNLEARNELGLTPLQVAVLSGHLAASALLVDIGANVNARDPDGNTLLHQILQSGTMLAVRDRPPTNWFNRLEGDRRKQTHLQYLTVGRYEQGPHAALQLASFLLACGIDVSATNHAGRSVMQLATDEDVMQRAMLSAEDTAAFMKLLAASGGKIDRVDGEGETALHRAGQDILVDRVAGLIAGGVDINATNYQGRSPLHKFVEKIAGWDESEAADNQPLQLLIKSKPNINARDKDGLTPLHVLAQADTSFKKEATKLLLDAGADPNARDNRKRTPVHLFLTGDWPWSEAGECISLLVKYGADLSLPDDEGRTPLHNLAAIKANNALFFIRGITNVFASPKVDFACRDHQGDTPLHLAARSGASDVFQWLRSRGASIDATNQLGETPRQLAANNTQPFTRFRFNADTDIFQAAREGKLESLAALIKADPAMVNATNQFGQTALRSALIARQTNAVEFLEQHGARWDAASAVMAGRAQMLREILAGDAAAMRESVRGKGLLHIAAGNGDLEIIQILILAGDDLRAQDDWGFSPLGCALSERQTKAADLLRKHGAQENIFDAVGDGDFDMVATLLAGDRSLAHSTNRFGRSILEIAAEKGSARILSLLLDKSANTDLTNKRSGMMLLHAAAMADQPEATELLILRGAAVEARNDDGFTALHVAAMQGSINAAAALLRHKADANALTGPGASGKFPAGGPLERIPLPGSTPLHLASLCLQTNMVSLLLKSEAAVNATNSIGMTALDIIYRPGAPLQSFWMRHFISRSPAEPSGNRHPMFNPLESAGRRRIITALLENSGGKRTENLSR